jgi:beta-glucosidase
MQGFRSFGTWRDRYAIAHRLAVPADTLRSAVIGALSWRNETTMTNEADPDARAASLVAVMSLDEVLTLLHGYTSVLTKAPPGNYERSNGLGFVPGVARLGIPVLRQTDGQMGIGGPAGNIPGAEATQLPSGLAMAATWNPALAEAAGAVIGREARAKGFNIVLAGSVNLIRDPRGGRCFEYPGEDPLLAGTTIGHCVRGIQSVEGLVTTVKHFALNAYESGRMQHNVVVDRAAAMESDLLAFRIAIAIGDPGAVMASYNAVNGEFAGENYWLLTEVLRVRWRFRGWVMSDFGGVHSTAKAALAGLDQESACESDRIVGLGGMALLNGALAGWGVIARIALEWITGDIRRHAWFGQALAKAVATGEVPEARLREMAQRILRTLAKHGVLGAPPRAAGVDLEEHAAVACRAAREAIVLLKNEGSLLPLVRPLKSVAVIGKYANVGLPSGSGSPMVLPIGGNAIPTGRGRLALLRTGVWVPCAPLASIRAKVPEAAVAFADGTDLEEAVRLARNSEIVVLFVHQRGTEGRDQTDLSLPDEQDALVARVAAANPATIVVVSCSGPVLMPWAGAAGAILCAWYSGQRGAEAIADILFGDAEPCGRLPVTFPQSVEDLPRPKLPQVPHPGNGAVPQYDLRFDEGAAVGYRWFDRKNLPVLFPFGYGLGYTRFRYDSMTVASTPGGASADLSITNIGERAGVETVQIYIDISDSGLHQSRRLGGWARVFLNPGASGRVAIRICAFMFAKWDEAAACWKVEAGIRQIRAGASSRDLRLEAALYLEAASIPP